MAMDMLEHEHNQHNAGALASRTSSTIMSIGSGTEILDRTFLVKRMEIEFMITPWPDVTIAALDTPRKGYLVFINTSRRTDADTVAESFDAPLTNKEMHQGLIWSRPFVLVTELVDDTENVVDRPQNPSTVFKTSKSFSKGFPLDKDETYAWQLFNAGGNAWASGSDAYLHIRYWGIYV